VTLSHSGDGLKKPRNIQQILLVMTLMENTCQPYNLTMLLIALVSICAHGFESVITFIVYTLKISTRFSMKETLKIPILRTDNKMAKGKTNTDLYSITQKTNDRATRTLLKGYEGELRCSG
jgi:hypothetical protein